MKLTFLGTGTSQGVPFIGCTCEVCQSNDPRDNRLRTSVHIQYKDISFVIDTGPDFRQQMLKHSIHDLDFVLYTHSHKDHIAGLDDIKAYNYWHKKALDIYGNDGAINRIKTEFDYVFSDFRYPGIPEINAHIISEKKPVSIKGIDIQPILVMHHQMQVLGFRIDKLTYITDANFISEIEKEKIKGSEVMVINALRHEKHISHFTLSEAIELAIELKIPRVYLTHISHQLGLHADIDAQLPAHISLAYDGLSIDI